MTQLELPADSFRSLRYTTPSSKKATYRVESSAAVTTYVVDADGLKAFEAGEDVPSHGGFGRRRLHTETVRFDWHGRWFLIISNRNKQGVSVSYEVES